MFFTHKKTVPYLCLICLVTLAGQARATTYTGELSYNSSGLFATAEWANSATMLSWTVTNEDPDPTLPSSFAWKYTYTLTVFKKGISHMIVEASNGENPFTSANIKKVAGISDLTSEVKEYYPTGESGSNPLMPSAMYGIKLEGWSGDHTLLSLSFYSDRDPVWGDFYAKDGNNGPVVLYNTGFSDTNDVDPTAPADNGPYEGHLLVPDTVPEPGLLTLLGLGGLGLLRKKRR